MDTGRAPPPLGPLLHLWNDEIGDWRLRAGAQEQRDAGVARVSRARPASLLCASPLLLSETGHGARVARSLIEGGGGRARSRRGGSESARVARSKGGAPGRERASEREERRERRRGRGAEARSRGAEEARSRGAEEAEAAQAEAQKRHAAEAQKRHAAEAQKRQRETRYRAAAGAARAAPLRRCTVASASARASIPLAGVERGAAVSYRGVDSKAGKER